MPHVSITSASRACSFASPRPHDHTGRRATHPSPPTARIALLLSQAAGLEVGAGHACSTIPSAWDAASHGDTIRTREGTPMSAWDVISEPASPALKGLSWGTLTIRRRRR